MKAIVTKYIGPTNTKPARIKASANGVKPLVISYHSHTGSHNNPHATAALMLCERMGWKGTLVNGGLPDESGEVFCFLDSEQYQIPAQRKAA